jgi:hypothetical protein
MLDNFCGCSLLFGVEIIALNQILYSILSLSLASSKEELEIGGLVITPTMEVAYAAWCLMGIPLAIGAGVGALYQMPFHLRMFELYLVALFVAHLGGVMGALGSGVLCESLVAPEVQRLGQHFVCAFVDAFLAFWLLIILCVQAYCIYVVHSAAAAITERSKYPELLAAANKLRSLPKPEAPPPFESPPYVPRPAQPMLPAMQVPQPQPMLQGPQPGMPMPMLQGPQPGGMPMPMPMPMQMQAPQPMAQSLPAPQMAAPPQPMVHSLPAPQMAAPIGSQPQPMSEPRPGLMPGPAMMPGA